jgi:hypothetical protein
MPRKKKLDNNALDPTLPTRVRARTRRLACDNCGKPIEHRASRRPRFCSDRCRARENGRRRARKAFLRPGTGAATKRKKIDSNNNALEQAKRQSSTSIIGPRRVLDVEVWDRPWEIRVSPDGVAVMVSRLPSRAVA